MKKQFSIFIFIVFILFLFNRIFVSSFSELNILGTQELVNKRQVSAQRLFEDSWKVIRNNYYDSKMNEQDWIKWKKRYEGKILTPEDADVAINTILSSLDDPYSRFLNKKDFKEQNESIESKISGIGVNIAPINGKVVVLSVIEGTPAASAKFLPNDIIIAVDGKDTKGLQVADVANLVRGPENSPVRITILRGKQKITKSLIRKEIKIKTVKSSIEKNVGYIQILTFIGQTTADEFIEALEKTQDTKGLIIDLRGNTGGLLPNAVFIANMFINDGNIVSIVGRNGYKKDISAQHTDLLVEKPMVILVDGTSASASEILSGALKDHHKAKLIGTNTFGKGMVQKIIPMPNETGLNLTIAKYLTPAGHDINKIGIAPDVEVKLSEKDYFARNDVQLKQAKTLIASMILKEK